MRLRVLGASAGGGFPQWNCACENCRLARAGDPGVRPATQDSVAIAAGDDAFVVVNASPDVHAQIARTPELWPRRARHTPIAAIVLTNGDLDHVLGLFSLRESQPLVVFATDAVRAGLEEGNAIMRTLARWGDQLTWKRLALGEEVPVFGQITARAVAAPGKLPVHLVGRRAASPEDNVGVVFRDGRATAAYFASTAAITGDVTRAIDDADVVLFDGTFWSSDELVSRGLGTSRAEDMAHLPIGGEGGSLAQLHPARARRRIYTHVNNTNPVLREGSEERRAVTRAGWEIAHDGMEIEA